MIPAAMLAPIMIGLLVAAVVGVLLFVLAERTAPRAAERLDTLVGKRRKESAADLLLKEQARDADKKNLMDAVMPEILTFQKVFEQADCNIKPSALFSIALVMGGMCGTFSLLIIKLQTGSLNFFVAPVAAMIGFSLPFIWLWNKRRNRLKAFASQLPDALELVARALRAGHALGAGMHVVAEEMPSPIADEFGRVYEEQNLGIALEDAMRNMAARVPNMDLQFFVTAVAIQRQTGGDLAEILDKIGYVVRERYKILGQVKALTAEGRLSGVVLIALPFFLALIMMHLNYGYIQMLWTHPMGIKMSIGGIILMALGALVIKKIVDIKV
ncbi:MAG: type II secretion system F family protein [Planctomycetia bacterium]|nr:type II secretion system F family protein [Planctomycetia bacterium]